MNLCHIKSMKNTHLQHPEDSILTGDLSVLDWFLTDGEISAKIDGSPAIVWGKNPSSGKFRSCRPPWRTERFYFLIEKMTRQGPCLSGLETSCWKYTCFTWGRNSSRIPSTVWIRSTPSRARSGYSSSSFLRTSGG